MRWLKSKLRGASTECDRWGMGASPNEVSNSLLGVTVLPIVSRSPIIFEEPEEGPIIWDEYIPCFVWLSSKEILRFRVRPSGAPNVGPGQKLLFMRSGPELAVGVRVLGFSLPVKNSWLALGLWVADWPKLNGSPLFEIFVALLSAFYRK